MSREHMFSFNTLDETRTFLKLIGCLERSRRVGGTGRQKIDRPTKLNKTFPKGCADRLKVVTCQSNGEWTQEATHQIQKNEDTGIWYRWDRLAAFTPTPSAPVKTGPTLRNYRYNNRKRSDDSSPLRNPERGW